MSSIILLGLTGALKGTQGLKLIFRAKMSIEKFFGLKLNTEIHRGSKGIAQGSTGKNTNIVSRLTNLLTVLTRGQQGSKGITKGINGLLEEGVLDFFTALLAQTFVCENKFESRTV